MNSDDRERLQSAIDARLASLAQSLPEPPAWYESWFQLGPKSTREERLLVCRAIRDSGTLSDDVGYFLVCWMIEDIAVVAESELEDRLLSTNQREIRRASNQIFFDMLVSHGEPEMAERFRTDPIGHAQRREVGRQFFFKAKQQEPPENTRWMRGLAKAVSFSLRTDQKIGRLGVQYREEEGVWEVSMFPLPEDPIPEKTGSPPGSSGLAWDIESLRPFFDRIDGGGWYAVCDEGEPPYVWLEGVYNDHAVFLRLLAHAPARVEPGERWEDWRRDRE